MAHRKVALVTGAGSGIGRASALALAKEGYAVGALSRTEEEVAAVVDEIHSNGGEGVVLVGDVSNEQQIGDAVETLVSKFGGIDAVVANAGINGIWSPIEELKPDEWDKTIQVNLRGTYLTIHKTVPHLKANGGSIVIVASINGTRTFTSPGATAYTVTKAGQVAMAQQLALELGRYRIRLNAVCPGQIDTEIEDNTNIRDEEETGIPVEWPDGQIPISGGTPGRSEDVADLIVFLSGEKSRHITGSPVWIDGGQGLLR